MPESLEIIPTSLEKFTSNYFEKLLNTDCKFYDDVKQKYIIGDAKIEFVDWLTVTYQNIKFSLYKRDFEYDIHPAIEYIDGYANNTKLLHEEIANHWESIGFSITLTPYTRLIDRNGIEFKTFSLALMQAIDGVAFIESNYIFDDIKVGLYDFDSLRGFLLNEN